MDLIRVDTTNHKEFIKFYENFYLNNPLTRNSMSSILRGLLKGKLSICKSTYIEPLMVKRDGEIIMICILAQAHRMPEYMQISFFEAKEDNPAAFKMIVARANELAREKGARKLSGSLNIHVNYGLGFLASHYEDWQSFGTPYNPDYYNKLFEDEGFTPIDMVSLHKDIRNMEELFPKDLQKKLDKRYRIRQVDFSRLAREVEIYTRINNQAFHDHVFYYPREKEEDLELFKDLRYFLRPENLLFVERDGQAIGFMLWYPDFHELMKPNETIGLRTVIKNRFFANKIKTLRIVEIGIVPSQQNKGAILALFSHLYRSTKNRFDSFESGWIIKDNDKSLNLSMRWSDGIYKHYKAYTRDLSND